MTTDFAVGSAAFEIFAFDHEDDTRAAVRKALEQKRDEAKAGGETRTVNAIERTLRSRRRLNRIAHRVEREAVPQFLAARASGAIGADGEFFKWLMVWLFEEGNWKKILEAILALLAL